jgi:dolichol-phosphate mannosyltransferase
MTRAVVLLPTYNEAANLEAMVEALLQVTDADVLIIDDNSPDGTGHLARALHHRHLERVRTLHRPGKEGLGRAYADGYELALARGYEVVVQMDADFSHDPHDVPRLIGAVASGAGVAIGSRYVPGGSTPGLAWHRRLLSRFGSRYAAAVLGLPIRDVTGGFKAFSRAALLALRPRTLRSAGFAVQIETTHRAFRRGLIIREIPIAFHDRQAGQSKMSLEVIGEALRLPWQLRRAVDGDGVEADQLVRAHGH